MKRFTLIAAALCFLCSCSIYKEYSRPDLTRQLDSLFGPAVPDTAALASYDWRSIFKDSLLVRYIEQGLANNKDIKVAEKRIEMAKAALMTSKGAFLPSLGIAGNGSYASSQSRYSGGAYSYGVPLTMSWEIDFAGGKFNKMRKSKAEFEQSKVYLRKVQSDLIASIANTYYSLLKLDAQLAISRSTSKSWKMNVEVMKAMMQAGMTNAASISQTEANSCSIEASLFELEYQITQVENNFALLLGISPRHFERSRLKDAAFACDLSCGVPASLLSHRPDVMLAEYNLRKAYYDVAIAKAAFYPSLNLTGQMGWDKALTSPASMLYSIAASLAQPIYANGRIRRGLEIARASQESATAEFEKTLLQAGGEVNNAIALCRSARGRAEVRVRQIAALESAVQSTSQLMRHAQSTYLEILTAQQSLLSAQLLQINDSYDAALGTIMLFKALGGGIE